MENRPTLKDLSRSLNLSISTVSKALNDSPEISIETRKRVKDLAKLNHYIPNTSARNLKSKKTFTIGVIIPSVQSQFFNKALNGIESKAKELGFKIMICISNESLAKEKESIETLIESQVDGLILSLSKETQSLSHFNHLINLQKYNIPIVLFDRITNQISCDKISIDDVLYSELAVDDLYQSGNSKIAYISGTPNISVNNDRKTGFLSGIHKMGLEEIIFEAEIENFPDYEILDLIKKKSIDGILASDELTAIRLMRLILKAGYRIPDDISVIGFTNGLMGENFVPSLTTIDQKAEEQGALALATIVDRINKELTGEPMEFLIDAEIIHRESTKGKRGNLFKY